MRKKDKIQEAYEKIIVEGRKWKYIRKANDGMAEFLEEIKNAVYEKEEKGGKLTDLYGKIDDDWNDLWDKIATLAKKL